MQTWLLMPVILISLAAGAPSGWRQVAPGMELGIFTADRTSPAGDSRITVLRIDPNLYDLVFVGLGLTGDPGGRTVRQWCEKHGLAAGINAGMYAMDYRTHIGYLRYRGRLHSGRVNGYRSVAAFDPKEGKNLPRFRIFDLDAPGVTLETILADYESAVQNLRLIKRPGLNQWKLQDKSWSEAALGKDSSGRILFIFSGSPYTMHDFNRELLSLGIGVVAAQHLEGGPQAQMYLRAGGEELEMAGSSDAPLPGNGGKPVAWPVPNVLGVRPRPAAGIAR